mgnify:CR=1 FL=1|tara:strand:+ start:4450 stop:4635 length:186 start_codon:yes stop_codon:yes gene_type:complete
MSKTKNQTKKEEKPLSLKEIESDIKDIKDVIGVLTNTIHKMTQNEDQFRLKLSKVADRLGL